MVFPHSLASGARFRAQMARECFFAENAKKLPFVNAFLNKVLYNTSRGDGNAHGIYGFNAASI